MNKSDSSIIHLLQLGGYKFKINVFTWYRVEANNDPSPGDRAERATTNFDTCVTK